MRKITFGRKTGTANPDEAAADVRKQPEGIGFEELRRAVRKRPDEYLERLQ